MKIENKTYLTFEEQDRKEFCRWKDKHDLSYRQIAREIGVSCTFLCDMVAGKNYVNGKFLQYLCMNKLITDETLSIRAE